MNTSRSVLTSTAACATPQGMALFETVVNHRLFGPILL
jgi:hypothetical protein